MRPSGRHSFTPRPRHSPRTPLRWGLLSVSLTPRVPRNGRWAGDPSPTGGSRQLVFCLAALKSLPSIDTAKSKPPPRPARAALICAKTPRPLATAAGGNSLRSNSRPHPPRRAGAAGAKIGLHGRGAAAAYWLASAQRLRVALTRSTPRGGAPIIYASRFALRPVNNGFVDLIADNQK